MATYDAAAEAIARPAVRVTGMQAMASRMWAPFIIMGVMVVLAAFVIGVIVAQVSADYFGEAVAAQETAGSQAFVDQGFGSQAEGKELVDKKVFIESTNAWLTPFTFLGLGMILGGITFLLATILGTLRVAGGNVQQALGTNIVVPSPPVTARLFPMFMMVGLMIMIAAMVIGIILAVLNADYWDHSIVVLNAAPAGAELVSDLGTIKAVEAWLTPFKFMGMAILLSGIGLALTTIVWTLRFQSRRLLDILAGRP